MCRQHLENRGRPRSARPVQDALPKTVTREQAREARDAAKAYRSVLRLVALPAEACTLVGKRLPPARGAPPERLAEWLRGLDSDEYEAREAAMRALRGMGEEAEGALRQALRGEPSVEQRRRVEVLLSLALGATPSGDSRSRNWILISGVSSASRKR